MEHKPFIYFLNRVREKIADFEHYEFGKQEETGFCKAEVLNILQELIRESDTREECAYFSKAILSATYGYTSRIYYLVEEKDSVRNLVTAEFSDLAHETKLPLAISEQMRQEHTVHCSEGGSAAFFPIRGKRSIQQEIGYPLNSNVVIGALEIKRSKPLIKADIFFLEKYCRRLGMGLHFLEMVEYNKMLNQHIMDMLTVASHDIRSPLNSIAVGLKVLDKELYGKLDPNVKEVVKALLRKAHSLSLTLETYLGETSLFSGALKIVKEKLDYRMDIIDPILEEFSDAFAQHHIRIDESMGGIPERMITIKADRIWLLSVYRNLFSNVVKYGGPGCTVAFGFEDWQDHYRLNVFNTGRSIDPDQQERLFQRFSRIEAEDTKNVKGAGFGLFFVKEIVERHGGKIWYEPKPDGSNFVFTLPKD